MIKFMKFVAVQCPRTPVLDYADPSEGTNEGGISYGATVRYECDQLTKAKFEDGTAEKTITCTEYQWWTETNFTCSRGLIPATAVVVSKKI